MMKREVPRRYPLDHGTDSMALYWVMRFKEGGKLTDDERENFQEWVLDDPEHEDRFVEYGAITRLTRDLRTSRSVRKSEGDAPPRRTMRDRLQRIASVVLVILGGLISADHQSLENEEPSSGVTYATQTGKSQTVEFGEGSVAYLNTRTQLRWLGQQENQRRVELLAGEATFEVARDKRRPFAVLLDGSEILVSGTRFNVYRKPGGQTLVTVYEGSVEVRRLESKAKQPAWVRKLSANQQMEYGLSGPAPKPRPADLLLASWRSGKLQLPRDGAPLPEVVDELERYTDKSIVLGDTRLSAVTIGGSFSTLDVLGTLGDLARTLNLHVFESGDAFVLDNPPSTETTRDDDSDDQL